MNILTFLTCQLELYHVTVDSWHRRKYLSGLRQGGQYIYLSFILFCVSSPRVIEVMSGFYRSSENAIIPSDAVRGKVAIPRLPNKVPELNHLRTPQACSACRRKKAKCDGQRPKCGNCQRLNRACIFTGFKKDHQRMQLQSLQQKAQSYEGLLGEIISQATVQENISIQNVFKVG